MYLRVPEVMLFATHVEVGDRANKQWKDTGLDFQCSSLEKRKPMSYTNDTIMGISQNIINR